MSKITGLENIRELYDMWSRNRVATYKYEGLEKLGTKEREFSLPGGIGKEEIESLVEELTGRNLPIVGDWQTGSTFYHTDFYVPVEIDGIPVKVEFGFGGESGGEANIDLDDGKIYRRHGPNPRTTRFADFQGFVGSQTVDLTVTRFDGGPLKASQIRDLLDSIRLGLPGLVGWFQFFNDNSKKSEELYAHGPYPDNGNEEWEWTFFDNSRSKDLGYEDALWICRFWSFCPIQNRHMTPEEEALTKVHKSLRGGSFTLGEIGQAENGENILREREAIRERECQATHSKDLLREAIRERDEKAAAEKAAAEKKQKELQDKHKKLTEFLTNIADFVVPCESSKTIRDLWWELEGFTIILLNTQGKESACLAPADSFDENRKKIIEWAVDLGAKEPSVLSDEEAA